jgi:hypothetical protein
MGFLLVVVLIDAYPECRSLLAAANHRILCGMKNALHKLSLLFLYKVSDLLLLSPSMEQLQPHWLSTTLLHHPRSPPLHPRLSCWPLPQLLYLVHLYLGLSHLRLLLTHLHLGLSHLRCERRYLVQRLDAPSPS